MDSRTKLTSYWLDAAPGASAALALSMKSARVVVCEAHMGAVMAEVMGGRPELNPWKDFDWPAIPGHIGPPWFLPLVGAWRQLQDRLH